MQVLSPLESIGAAYAAIQDSASTEEAALRNCKTAVVDIQSLEHTACIRAAAGAYQRLNYMLEMFSSRTSWGLIESNSCSCKVIIPFKIISQVCLQSVIMFCGESEDDMMLSLLIVGTSGFNAGIQSSFPIACA